MSLLEEHPFPLTGIRAYELTSIVFPSGPVMSFLGKNSTLGTAALEETLVWPEPSADLFHSLGLLGSSKLLLDLIVRPISAGAKLLPLGDTIWLGVEQVSQYLQRNCK